MTQETRPDSGHASGLLQASYSSGLSVARPLLPTIQVCVCGFVERLTRRSCHIGVSQVLIW